VGNHAGWRVAFLVCGIPGLFAAFLCWWIKEPPIGGMVWLASSHWLAAADRTLTLPRVVRSHARSQDGKRSHGGPPVPWREVLQTLPRNSTYLFLVGGTTMAIFGSGGMADWYAEAVRFGCLASLSRLLFFPLRVWWPQVPYLLAARAGLPFGYVEHNDWCCDGGGRVLWYRFGQLLRKQNERPHPQPVPFHFRHRTGSTSAPTAPTHLRTNTSNVIPCCSQSVCSVMAGLVLLSPSNVYLIGFLLLVAQVTHPLFCCAVPLD
jgi:hypothetical protein